jgi:hypothetical protein
MMSYMISGTKKLDNLHNLHTKHKKKTYSYTQVLHMHKKYDKNV